MDEIAAEAETSKTVLYRHFGDRAGLYLAVVESVDRLIVGDLEHALGTAADRAPRDADDERATTSALVHDPALVIEAAVDAYLTLVERDPEVYRFVVMHPLLDRPMGEDPVTGLTRRIGDRLATLLAVGLAEAGRPNVAAAALAHGVVGLVRAAADYWLATPEPLPRRELARQLGVLIGGGLTAVLDPQEES